MPYTVPQFIEKEPKIVGPLTFKQFLFFLVAAGIGFILYVFVGKKNLFLFLILAVIIFVFSFFLAFGNVGGRPFPVFLKNLLFFLISPKLFSFEKKIFGIKLFPERIPKLMEEKKVPFSSSFSKGRLQQLSTQIETKRR